MRRDRASMFLHGLASAWVLEIFITPNSLHELLKLRVATVNVKSKVTLLRSAGPPHLPSCLGHPLPQGGEGSANLNPCPRSPRRQRVARRASQARGSVAFSSSFTLVRELRQRLRSRGQEARESAGRLLPALFFSSSSSFPRRACRRESLQA